MRKLGILLIGTVLLLTSCAPNKKEEEIVQKKDEPEEQELSIVPSYQLSEDNYKMILPFRPSQARGVIVNQLGNRLDIDEMEEGLRRHSTEAFDPEKYYFEEGQYLTSDMVYDWLGRYPTEKQFESRFNAEVKRRKNLELNINEDHIRAQLQQGLNPPLKDKPKEEDYRKSPQYLSHILEQNFLERTDDNAVELVGISIGLALKSVYRFQTETGGTDYYQKISNKEMKKQGNEIAQTILERLRKIEGLENVPIMFALYREEEESSPIPGNFVAKTSIAAGDMKIGEWKSTNEEYILFPSDQAKEKYFDDYEIVSSFGKDISEYFPNYVGYIGEGFYVDGELKKMSIEIPIEFFGSAEIVGFTQYTYGIVKGMFPNYYDLEITVKSSEKVESLIYREAGAEDPTVHIFH